MQVVSSDPEPTVPIVLVRDLTDGQDLDQVLLVRAIDVRPTRDGGEYLELSLGDRSGQVAATVWGAIDQAARVVVPGRPVRVIGRYTVHPHHGAQIAVRALRPPAPDSFDLTDLCDGPPLDAAQMEADLRTLIATIQSPSLRTLLDRLLGPDTPTWRGYRAAPAAKFFHQAYVHGLLEHSLSVAQAVSAISATFPGIDRDVAVTGALLHDIGKLEAYATHAARIELTDAERLHGHIPLGYYRVRRAIEDIDGFPADVAQHLLHIVLSHHGTLEHGSPVVPATREATLVHFVDNLGGRLGSFDRLEKQLAPGATWSGFDRAIGGGAFFGAVPADAAERRAA